MMKALATALSLVAMTALVTLASGCSAETAPAEAQDTEALKTKKKHVDPAAPVVTVTEVDVPVSSASFSNEHSDVWLDWPDLWKYTKLAHSSRLSFSVPATEEAECDDACGAAILARAAAHGGKLHGKLTVDRHYAESLRPDGTCILVVEETVSLDLRKSTEGIAKELASLYPFLVLGDFIIPSVELDPIPCTAVTSPH